MSVGAFSILRIGRLGGSQISSPAIAGRFEPGSLHSPTTRRVVAIDPASYALSAVALFDRWVLSRARVLLPLVGTANQGAPHRTLSGRLREFPVDTRARAVQDEVRAPSRARAATVVCSQRSCAPP